VTLRSFRDPDGFLTDDGRCITRTVAAEASSRCREWLDSALYSRLVDRGWLIRAERVVECEDGGLLIAHPRIRMPAYPAEWTPSMLAAAALRTLEIQREAWHAGWTLKDAAASNILFESGTPVLCDLMSIVPRDPRAGHRWVAYGQFVRQFVIPLLLAVDQGVMPREVFLAHRDGLRARDAMDRLRWWRLLQPAVFLHVSLPAWLESRALRRVARHDVAPSDARTAAADPVTWTIDSLQRLVAHLARTALRPSVWSDYGAERDHYGDSSLAQKRNFIDRQLQVNRPRQVLDIGSNTGEYSQMALSHGAEVVALDDDASALDRLYLHAKGERIGLTCIHANFARPTPPTGWRLQESLSLDTRLASRFDVVIVAAVLHHLIVTERLPLSSLMEQLAACCSGTLIVEFIDRADPKFKEIAGLNMDLYGGWSLDNFIATSARWFDPVEIEQLPDLPTRTLVALRRRAQ
jgi:SAM-dependent methyltransferase